MEPSQVKMPCGSIKGTQTTLPSASPQVVQTRKHSAEVRIAESRTPYKFPLILALAGLTAVSVLEGQSGHSSHRGQASCRLPSERSHEKGPLQRHLHILLTAGSHKPYCCCLHGTQLLKWSQSITRVFASLTSFYTGHRWLNAFFHFN